MLRSGEHLLDEFYDEWLRPYVCDAHRDIQALCAKTRGRHMAMKIHPFDEDLSHREILPYRPVYRDLFVVIRNYIEAGLPSAEVIHTGSTAIPDLRGKPMLDLVVVSTESDLRLTQRQLEAIGFHRRDVWVDRDDKPYVCGSISHDDTRYNVNVHVCHRGDPVHTDSLAFIEILRSRPDLRRRYEQAKDRAHAIDPADPQVYNLEKEAVIREIHDYSLTAGDDPSATLKERGTIAEDP